MSPHPAAALDTAALLMDGDHQVYPTTAHTGLSVHSAVPAIRRDSHTAGVGGMDLVQLRRFQWAVRAALVLGVAVSVCANVLHAHDNVIAQTIAAWPPLALMLTVELISRVPVHRRTLATLRVLATASIAGIAAYVSYFHMAAVVARYGEHQPNPYLLPISVDGLIVVASVSLVELAGRVRTARNNPANIRRADPLAPDKPPRPDANTASAEPSAEPARSNGRACAALHAARPLPATAPPPAGQLPTATTTPPLAPPVPVPSPHVQPPAVDRHDDADEERDHNIDPDIAMLLPAARTARDTLRQDGRSLSRDSLAAQLRRDGHTIRTSRASALLNALRNEPAAVNGRCPSTRS